MIIEKVLIRCILNTSLINPFLDIKLDGKHNYKYSMQFCITKIRN